MEPAEEPMALEEIAALIATLDRPIVERIAETIPEVIRINRRRGSSIALANSLKIQTAVRAWLHQLDRPH